MLLDMGIIFIIFILIEKIEKKQAFRIDQKNVQEKTIKMNLTKNADKVDSMSENTQQKIPKQDSPEIKKPSDNSLQEWSDNFSKQWLKALKNPKPDNEE